MVLIGFNLGIVSCEDNVKMENESRVDSDKRTLSYLDRLGVKYVLETEHADDCLEKIVYVYKKTFVGTRNGLFVGFGFVSVRMFLGKWQDYF